MCRRHNPSSVPTTYQTDILSCLRAWNCERHGNISSVLLERIRNIIEIGCSNICLGFKGTVGIETHQSISKKVVIVLEMYWIVGIKACSCQIRMKPQIYLWLMLPTLCLVSAVLSRLGVWYWVTTATLHCSQR